MESIDVFNEEKIEFKKAIIPGVIVSALFIIYSIVLSMFDLEAEQLQKFGYISWIIAIPIIAYLTIEYRKSDFNNNFKYKEAFLFIFYITIIYSVIYALYNYLNLKFIEIDGIDKILIASEEQMYKQGQLEQSQIDTAVNMQKKFLTPFTISILSFFSSLFFGTILGLLIAIFTKNTSK